MRFPKEPSTWRYPRLYLLISKYSQAIDGARIVYPGGRGDYSGIHAGGGECFQAWEKEPEKDFACWQQGRWDFTGLEVRKKDLGMTNFKLANLSRQAMFSYAEENFLDHELVYAGEIK